MKKSKCGDLYTYLQNNIDKITHNKENDSNIQKLTADLFSFTPENSNWDVENVKEALDYLYNS